MTSKTWAYEDFVEGGEIVFGPKTVDEAEMIEFARQFDPQPFHLEQAAGKDSILGGLAASGLFTAATFMRMMCDGFILDSTSQGSPGVDEVRFRRPVMAGDELTGRTTVLSKRLSASRPGLGFVSVRHTLTNQRGEVVCEMSNTGMFLTRGAGDAA